jgi:hypothetical protein
MEVTTMKKLFLGKNGKNLIGGAGVLSIMSLIIVTTFTAMQPSFARSLKTADSFCKRDLPSGVSKDTCKKLVQLTIDNPEKKKLVLDDKFVDKWQAYLKKGNFGSPKDSGEVKPNFSKLSTIVGERDCETEALTQVTSKTYEITLGAAPEFCKVKISWKFSATSAIKQSCTFDMKNFEAVSRSDVLLNFFEKGKPEPSTAQRLSDGTFVTKLNIEKIELALDNSLARKTLSLGVILFKCSGGIA